MPGNNIIHIMNTTFGKTDQYGVRSQWIVESADHTVSVFARGRADRATAEAGTIDYHEIHLPLITPVIRYALTLLRLTALKRRIIWRAFDHAVAKEIAQLDLREYAILHTWEWIPETIGVAKAANPDIAIVRDVVINRYNEYWSGTPIIDEIPSVDCFLSPSSFSTKLLRSWGIPAKQIAEIPFGVDCARFRPIEEKPPEPVRFAFSGGISRRKGVDSLLRAWAQMDTANTELHLYGHLHDDMRHQIKGLDRVFYHGFIDLCEELPKNHVFVFPSTLEGSAKSVYEALAAGLPVITTAEAGSVARHGIEGLIVPAGDDRSLTDAMKTMIEDTVLRTSMESQARKRALEYTSVRYGAAVHETYSALRQGGTEDAHFRNNARKG